MSVQIDSSIFCEFLNIVLRNAWHFSTLGGNSRTRSRLHQCHKRISDLDIPGTKQLVASTRRLMNNYSENFSSDLLRKLAEHKDKNVKISIILHFGKEASTVIPSDIEYRLRMWSNSHHEWFLKRKTRLRAFTRLTQLGLLSHTDHPFLDRQAYAYRITKKGLALQKLVLHLHQNFVRHYASAKLG